jgi:hypothetical protein
VTADEARHRERHVERVLDVVIQGVATLVSGQLAAEQALKVTERTGEAFEGTVGIDAAQDFEDRFLHRRRGADPHRGRDVEVVSEIIVHAIPTCPAPVGIGGGAALPLRGSVGHPARRVNQGASLGCVGR